MSLAVNPAGVWSPFIERHPDAGGKGTHALVIGVSAYDSLPRPDGEPQEPWELVQLESAATAALQFAEWLNKDYRSGEGAPLQSLRVLLSPEDQERERLGKRIGGASVATRSNVLDALDAWSDDLKANVGSTSLIYLAGHGVFANGERNLLLQDLSPRLRLDASLNVTSVLGSLTHYRLDASYAFVDTCSDWLSPVRQYGSRGLELEHDFQEVDYRRGDHRFFAAARGMLAYGHPTVGSLFGFRLNQELRRSVIRTPDGTWAVTPQILAERLGELTEDRWCQPQLVGAIPLRFQLPREPPMATIKVTLKPAVKAPNYTVCVLDEDDEYEFPPETFEPHPYKRRVEPGTHAVKLTGGSHPLRRKTRTLNAYQVVEFQFDEVAP